MACLAWGTFSLLEELLLMIVLSFSFREAVCFPKESNRLTWEYFVLRAAVMIGKLRKHWEMLIACFVLEF